MEAALPHIKEEEIYEIIKDLEQYHKIKLPAIRVKFSSNIWRSFYHRSFGAIDKYELTKSKFEHNLRQNGMTEDEIRIFNFSEPTVVLRIRPNMKRISLYASTIHELTHVAVQTLGINDEVSHESLAIAHEIRELLKATTKGLFTREEVDTTIDSLMKAADAARQGTNIFVQLGRMEFGVLKEPKRAVYFKALSVSITRAISTTL